MTEANVIGRQLEDAVRKIEMAILKASPNLKDEPLRIESNKRVVVDDVRHEIDIWVEIEPAKGYSSLFIFECKNWKERVSKNEIIVFSSKIDTVQAQRGFFVAKSFTKDAEAQALKDPRIELLLAKEHNQSDVPVPLGFHYVGKDKVHADFDFIQRGAENRSDRIRDILDPATVTATLNNSPLDLDRYIKEWAHELSEERMQQFPSTTLTTGLYDLEISSSREFERGRLIINHMDISSVTIMVSIKARVIHPAIISSFEVETRGRVITLQPYELEDGGKIEFALITIK